PGGGGTGARGSGERGGGARGGGGHVRRHRQRGRGAGDGQGAHDRAAAPTATRSGPSRRSLSEQRLKIEWPRVHLDAAIRTARPFAFGSIAVELDAVAIRIAQIDRFAHAMIRSALERYAVVDHATHRGGQGGTVGGEDRRLQG